MPLPFDGFLCRVLLYTATSFSSLNNVTVEFATPLSIAPTSQMFCFNSTTFQFTEVMIWSIQEGGSIFSSADATEKIPFPPYISDQLSAPPAFLLGGNLVSPIEVVNVSDILGSDLYYASTYFEQRYDDFQFDIQGRSLRGIVDWPANVETPQDKQINGNCFLLTGAWRANTRYVVTFSAYNPPAPNTLNTTAPFPALWMAPVDVSSQSSQVGKNLYQDTVLTVRGQSKYGAVCPLRESAQVLQSLWNAEAEAAAFGIPPPNSTVLLNQDPTTYYLAALTKLLNESVATNTSNRVINRSVFPFNQPPISHYTVAAFGSSPGCPANQAFTTQQGGQCIDCGTGAPTLVGLDCVCRDDTVMYLAGTTACGRSLSTDGVATSKSSLAYTLCEQYTKQKQLWINNRISEKVVARLFLKAFTQQAIPIMDWSQINAANTSFYDQYVFDERIAQSPTRTLGIKPTCNRDTGYGTFDNTFNNKKPGYPVYDYHFDAMNTFRVIGYILYSVAGRTCVDLWDPDTPKEWQYGFYEDILCKPLPKELTTVYPA